MHTKNLVQISLPLEQEAVIRFLQKYLEIIFEELDAASVDLESAQDALSHEQLLIAIEKLGSVENGFSYLAQITANLREVVAGYNRAMTPEQTALRDPLASEEFDLSPTSTEPTIGEEE